MAYIGKVPADVLIDPMVDSAAITDATIVTADIANDAVTSAKLAANSVDSSELIDGSVDNSHLAGSIAINKTNLTGGTGLTLSTDTLNVDAAQTQITSVGTLTSFRSTGIDDNADALSITIDSSERVGIGCTPAVSNVASALEFADAGKLSWQTAGGANKRAWQITTSQTADGDFQIMSSNSNDNTIDTNRLGISKEGLVTVFGALTANGNVTFNTADSETALTFEDAGTNAMHIKVGSGDEIYFGSNNSWQTRYKTDGNVQTQGDWVYTGNIVINEDGETPLHIKNTNTGAGQNCYLTIENDGGADTYLNFLQGSSNGYIKYTDEADMIFQTGGMNDRLTLDSSGATFAGDMTIESDSHAWINLKSSATSTATWLQYYTGSTARWLAGVEGSESDYQLYASGLGTRFRLTTAGNATFAGDVILASTKKLYLDGGGNSYISEIAGDDIDIVAGGNQSIQVRGANTTFAGTLAVDGLAVYIGQNSTGTSHLQIRGSIWSEPYTHYYCYSNYNFRLGNYGTSSPKKFTLQNNDNETVFESGGNNSKDFWFGGDVSAASFTDRTPYPETLKIAYDVLASHKKLDDYDKNDKEHQLDHTKLHDFAKPQITVSSGTPDNEVITKELGQDGRDASAVISCLVEVVNDLVSKVEGLENA